MRAALIAVLSCAVCAALGKCTLKLSEINFVDFLMQMNASNVNFTFEEPSGASSCTMLPGEPIDVYVDDADRFIRGMARFVSMTANHSAEAQLYAMAAELASIGSGDYGRFCAAYRRYAAGSSVSTLGRAIDLGLTIMCDFMGPDAKSGPVGMVVYRGGNLTSRSTAVNALRNYFTNQKLREEAMARNSTQIISKTTNMILYYIDSGQELMSGAVEYALDWACPRWRSGATGGDFVTAGRVVLGNLTGFWERMGSMRAEFAAPAVRRAMEGRWRVRGNYMAYVDIVAQGARQLSFAARAHLARPARLRASEVVEYSEPVFFNGTVCYLNETARPERAVVTLFDYLALSRINYMWNPALSQFAPQSINETSRFSFHMPRDHVRLLVENVNRLRRSPYFYEVFGDSLFMKADLQECRNGWPYFRDRSFGCPPTIFGLVPYTFTEEEEASIRGGVNASVCAPWDGLMGPVQGWVQYLNALLSPYLSLPLILPTKLVASNRFLSEQFAWAFFTKDGRVPGEYSRSDLPPFAEHCLLLKTVHLWFLVFAVLIIARVLVETCVRFWSNYRRTQTATPIVDAIIMKMDRGERRKRELERAMLEQ